MKHANHKCKETKIKAQEKAWRNTGVHVKSTKNKNIVNNKKTST